MKFDYVIVGGRVRRFGSCQSTQRRSGHKRLPARSRRRRESHRYPYARSRCRHVAGTAQNQQTGHLRRYRNRGLNGRKGYQPRGKALGGSSAINAMLYIRGQRQDYDGWADLGCDGWDWDSVLP